MISLPVHTDHQCAQQSFVAESTLATFYKSLKQLLIFIFFKTNFNIFLTFCCLCLYSWSFSTHLVHAFVKDRVKLLLLVLVVAHQVSLHCLVFFRLHFTFCHTFFVKSNVSRLTSTFSRLSAKILSMASLYLKL